MIVGENETRLGALILSDAARYDIQQIAHLQQKLASAKRISSSASKVVKMIIVGCVNEL